MLVLGTMLTVVAGAALDWYPSRIGGPADWLDDRLYRPTLSVLTSSANWLELSGLLYTLALILSFVGYALAARWAGRQRAGRRAQLVLIAGIQLALSAWLALQPYLSSQDIFSYAFYSHIFVRYHDNPYVAVPRDYPFDPLFSAIFWKDQPSNYGPVWTYLSALAPVIAGTRVGTTLLVLKAITILAAMAGTGVLWSTLSRLRPERRVLGTLLFAWNPLLLIESAEAGHNDVLMAFGVIASLWFWSRQRRTGALAMLTVAALAKYVAVILGPFYLIAWWKETGESPLGIIGRSILVGLGLSVVAFAPVYAGSATFAIVGFGSNAFAYTNSPMELVFREVRLRFGESSELTDLPMHYDGHWLGSLAGAILWTAPDEQQGTGVILPPRTPLLMVEPETGSWVHVYEARLGRFGFVRSKLVRPIPVPPSSVVPGTTAAVLAGISQDPDAQRANLVVRALSLLVFTPWYGLSLLRLARQQQQPLALPRVGTSVLVVYLLLVQSWFWPWYLIWVLPYAATAPDTRSAETLLVMTWTTSFLNAQPSVSPPPLLDWLYGSRVLLIYGLPVVVGLVRSGAATWLRDSAWRGAPARVRSPGCAVGWRVGGLLTWLRDRSLVRPRLDRLKLSRVAAGAFLALSLGAQTGAAPLVSHPPTIVQWQRAFDEALRLYSIGNYAGAIDELGAVLAAQPDEASVLRLRVAANLQLGRYAQTIPDLNALLRRSPADLDLHLERGVMYARVQRGDRALADFRFVAARDPADPAAYEEAGLVEFERGDLAAAKTDLERARSLAPRDARIASELANVLASAGRFRGALALYDTAITIDPTDARTYAERAALLRHLGSASATITDLRKILVLSSDLQQQHWATRLLASLTRSERRAVGKTG